MVSRNSIHGRDWPARSPDLNPLDFFLWGYLKSQVYSPWPNKLDELETNIRRVVQKPPARCDQECNHGHLKGGADVHCALMLEEAF